MHSWMFKTSHLDIQDFRFRYKISHLDIQDFTFGHSRLHIEMQDFTFGHSRLHIWTFKTSHLDARFHIWTFKTSHFTLDDNVPMVLTISLQLIMDQPKAILLFNYLFVYARSWIATPLPSEEVFFQTSPICGPLRKCCLRQLPMLPMPKAGPGWFCFYLTMERLCSNISHWNDNVDMVVNFILWCHC